jgi:Flagellar biosynthesis protein, FliO
MILRIRIPRPLFSSTRSELTTLAVTPSPRGATFSATLADCMDDWYVRQAPVHATARDVPAVRERRKPVGAVTRAFSWMQSKYVVGTTKRLRVAETVSLGEKRFVALVCVEGREFLIGGGSAGVSLLARLGEGGRNGAALPSGAAGGEASQ